MTRFSVKTKSVDGERVPFGPLDDSLPKSWTAHVAYSDSPLELELSARFDGRRVVIDRVTVIRPDGAGVNPEDLVALQLGQVVQHVAEGAVSPGHGAHVGRRPGRRPTDEELKLVAAVYWFHHVTWGAPRQAVMALWDIPRSTANRWLRRARELYPMPEVD